MVQASSGEGNSKAESSVSRMLESEVAPLQAETRSPQSTQRLRNR